MSIHHVFDQPVPDLEGQSILITGGTGSFGNHFVRHVLQHHNPAKLIVYSRDEQKQYEMEEVLPQHKHDCMRYFLGDVRDPDRLEMAMSEVDYVIHAAALKIIPTAEYNPIECVNTNVNGAQNVVKAAIRSGVKKVINVSTDKATNPINLYGATKLAAERIFIAANSLSGTGGPIFSVVRYGNVIGSRGSVVPYFQRLIENGAEALPITDERMTRFWITLTQGVNFVLSSLCLMQGGEVFVPKIASMKVVDLARHMAPHLSLETVGIRPGEKLHEILVTVDDTRNTVELADRYAILPSFKFWKAGALEGASPVEDEQFSYMSDNNPDWIEPHQLRSYLDSCLPDGWANVAGSNGRK